MTQAHLAAAADVSLSMVRKIEQGSRVPGDGVLCAIAAALHVDTARLLSGTLATDSRIHSAIPAVRAVVDTYDLPGDGPVRPLPELRAAVAEAVTLRLSSQYARLTQTAPPLISELTRAMHCLIGRERQDAAALLSEAYRSADAAAYKYGYYDLSARLVELMRWAARQAEDELLWAAAAYVRTETFFASHNLQPALQTLHTAIDALPPPVTADRAAALGTLFMRAAVVAGRMHERGTATELLREAKSLARDVREGIYRGTAFGPASLRIHEVSVAVELGNGSAALESAATWRPPQTLPAERRSHYHIEVAQAQLWTGLRDDALESLQEARRIAPQHVREHPRVRRTLEKLVQLHRSPPRTLLGYAKWAGAI